MRTLVAALLLYAGCTLAHAHKPSDSYLILTLEDGRGAGQWDIALRDLEFAIGLDANGDGDITWGELSARHAEVASYALARRNVVMRGAVCTLQATDHLVDQHSDGPYAVLKFTAACPESVVRLTLGYTLFGFNLGVELGQLAIVAAFLPLAYALRATWVYARVVFFGGSAAVAILATLWLLERALNIRLLS